MPLIKWLFYHSLARTNLCVCACSDGHSFSHLTALYLQLHIVEVIDATYSGLTLHRHAHFSIDSTPSFLAIRKFIVREVATDWRLVAIYLGLETSVIRMAITDHPQQCEHARSDIFERWLSWEVGTGERERTWRTVLSAVEEARHKAFVNRFKAERFNLH